MPSVDHGEHGRSKGQLTSRCTRYWVQAILTWLTSQGMARVDASTDGAWTLTERFRVHAKEIALERAYTFIAELHRTTAQQQAGVNAERKDAL